MSTSIYYAVAHGIDRITGERHYTGRVYVKRVVGDGECDSMTFNRFLDNKHVHPAGALREAQAEANRLKKIYEKSPLFVGRIDVIEEKGHAYKKSARG